VSVKDRQRVCEREALAIPGVFVFSVFIHEFVQFLQGSTYDLEVFAQEFDFFFVRNTSFLTILYTYISIVRNAMYLKILNIYGEALTILGVCIRAKVQHFLCEEMHHFKQFYIHIFTQEEILIYI